ncbi:MAG: TonB-dependent receptor [Nitrospira sp.]
MKRTGQVFMTILVLSIVPVGEINPTAACAQSPNEGLVAQTESSLEFNIHAQDLNSAILTFADRSGVQVFYDADRMTGLRTKGVTGHYTWQEALRTLLEGTGMGYRMTGEKTVTIQKDSSEGADLSPGQIGAVGVGVAAGASADASGYEAVAQKPVKVPEVVVKAVKQRETAELNNLPPDYAGGDVARGGRVGILGNKDMMDTPFMQMNYTSKIIQDQQVRFLTDVLRNDPSVQIGQPTATGFTNFAIRGFQIDSASILFNGSAIAPTQEGAMMTESVERIEVLRGPNALLIGARGSIGGMVNMVPKRAGDEPLTRLTGQYLSDTQAGGHVDIGRRFGSHKQFGIRLNGAYRNGNLSIDHIRRESALASVALDYRSDLVRLSVDFGYQEQEIQGARRQFNVASSLTTLPEPPDTRTNANQPFEMNHSRALYGTLRGEIDITKHITGFASFGAKHERRQSIFSTRQIANSQGSLAAGAASLFANNSQFWTFDVGLRGAFDTGPIQHKAVAAYNLYSRERKQSLEFTHALPSSNIYNPVFASSPASSLLPGYGGARKNLEQFFSSAVVSDTLSILDERVQVTGGVRIQQIKIGNFNVATGDVTREYDKSAVTPMVGLVIKPWQRVSFYGNYIEALEPGPTAPLTAVNSGEVFAPFVSKGYEVGVKMDFGRLATTLAWFQITQPSAFINPDTNVFGVDGEQRNRGVEFTVFGEVMDGLRLLGGTNYIDAELTRTEGAINQGNRVPISPFQFTLYGEWDVPVLKGATFTSRVTHAFSQYVNFSNTQEIPSWTQWDFGARYRFDYMKDKPITIRANIENLLDTNRWSGSFFAGQVFVRDPRTFLLSATVDF